MLQPITQNKISPGWFVAAAGAGLGFVFASTTLPGGADLYEYYLPFAQGCNACGFVPYYARLALLPLTVVPPPWTWTVLTLVSVILFIWIAYRTQTNPLWLMVSMPMMSQLWSGQIDILVILGLLWLLQGKTPYQRSAGIALALVKPQLSFLAIIFLFLTEEKKDWWKLVSIPLVMLMLSFFIFGGNWVFEWLSHALSLPEHIRRQASADIWHIGVVLIPLPLLFKNRLDRLTVSLAVASVATPFFSVYSYVAFLTLFSSWWASGLSYLWLLAWPYMGESAIRLAWVLPVGMIVYFVYTRLLRDKISSHLSRFTT